MGKGDHDNHLDDDLWAEVTKTVTPAIRDDVLFTDHALSKAKQAKKQLSAKQKSKPQPLSPVATVTKAKTSLNPADLRLNKPTARAGIDNASAKKLTKGQFEIDHILDLHGKTEMMAHKALSQFINQASRAGARTVLIITGKGADGKGVLRRKVPEWLKDFPLKDHILAISQASPKDGGGGALYVRLRRSRQPQKRLNS